MEIASERTGKNDVETKPARYAALGVTEYWRFDETGEFHGTRLAGDHLTGDHYEPIPVEEVAKGVLQGYSTALSLFVRWERGELRWHDPETGQEIRTFEKVDEARLAERQGRLAEQESRLAAEARVQELEAKLACRDQEG